MNSDGTVVRQPVAGDIVGTTVAVAACGGNAFEATWGWRLKDGNGASLAEGYHQGGGGTGVFGTFVFEAPVEGGSYLGPGTFEFFGDTGNENPEPVAVPVVVIPGAQGFVLHTVTEGETLSKIVRESRWSSPVTTVEAIAAANGLADPDYIEVGQELRIPV